MITVYTISCMTQMYTANQIYKAGPTGLNPSQEYFGTTGSNKGCWPWLLLQTEFGCRRPKGNFDATSSATWVKVT